jgi:hypothetical protein
VFNVLGGWIHFTPRNGGSGSFPILMAGQVRADSFL